MSRLSNLLVEMNEEEERLKNPCPNCLEGEGYMVEEGYDGNPESAAYDEYLAGVGHIFTCDNCGHEEERNVDVDETPEEYSQKLVSFITQYESHKILGLLEQKYCLEAIGTLHIQISEELRFLLTKRVKGHENIPLDEEDNKYKNVLEWIKNLKDYNLYQISYIFGRITKEERTKLITLNTMRNKFAHSFEDRKNYSKKLIKQIVEENMIIEERLNQEVNN